MADTPDTAAMLMLQLHNAAMLIRIRRAMAMAMHADAECRGRLARRATIVFDTRRYEQRQNRGENKHPAMTDGRRDAWHIHDM